MSNKLMCDRCHFVSWSADTESSAGAAFIHMEITGDDIRKYDLCDRCLAEFLEFIAGPARFKQQPWKDLAPRTGPCSGFGWKDPTKDPTKDADFFDDWHSR